MWKISPFKNKNVSVYISKFIHPKRNRYHHPNLTKKYTWVYFKFRMHILRLSVWSFFVCLFFISFDHHWRQINRLLKLHFDIGCAILCNYRTIKHIRSWNRSNVWKPTNLANFIHFFIFFKLLQFNCSIYSILL